MLVITQLMNLVFVPLFGHAGLALSIGMGAMVNAAWAGAAEADMICLLVDAPELIEAPDSISGKDTQRIIDGLNEAKRSAVLILNKIDATPHDRVLPLIKRLKAETPHVEEVIPATTATRTPGAGTPAHPPAS